MASFSDRAISYAESVLSGDTIACRWVRLAATRFLDDLSTAKKRGLIWDREAVERFCTFAELMPHIKGHWSSPTIELQDWQVFHYANVLGWKWARGPHEGRRRFRTSYKEIARKNGKSTDSATLGLYLLALDGEEGAEVYSAAVTRDQAKVVWSMAHAMTRKVEAFRDRFGVDTQAHSIFQLHTNSKFVSLSSDQDSLEGLNIHCGIVDELHAHKNRAVFDVLASARGARTQPLLWIITTAGDDQAGICYEQRTYTAKILEGKAEDDSFFGIIYTLDEKDDWQDESVWPKANPFLIGAPEADAEILWLDLRAEAAKARELASAQNNFRTKRMNEWVQADVAWMNMVWWDSPACAKPTLLEDFAGADCMGGIDLASRLDLAAAAFVFRDGNDYYPFLRYYLPEQGVLDRASTSAAHYLGWVREGRIVLTPGDVTDYNTIEEDLLGLAKVHRVLQFAYDPWQATQLATSLQSEGLTLVEIRPTVQNFSEPMKELEALAKSGKVHHGGDPVLRWNVANVICHRDAKDNIYPRKPSPDKRIDGVVAVLMALNRWLTQQETTSVYEERGVLAF